MAVGKKAIKDLLGLLRRGKIVGGHPCASMMHTGVGLVAK
jgi:hypothetical protein